MKALDIFITIAATFDRMNLVGRTIGFFPLMAIMIALWCTALIEWIAYLLLQTAELAFTESGCWDKRKHRHELINQYSETLPSEGAFMREVLKDAIRALEQDVSPLKVENKVARLEREWRRL